MFSVKHLGQQ